MTNGMDPRQAASAFLLLQSSALPPAPTRAEVLAAHLTFQGLTVSTPEIGGPQPWWEPQVAVLSPAGRRAVYAAKHVAGDTAILYDVMTGYVPRDRPSVPDYITIQRDFSDDPHAFRALVEEGLRAGFSVAHVLMGGDAGYEVGMRCLQAIMPALRQPPNLLPYVVVNPGFDTIIGYDERTQTFGPWTLDQVSTFLTTAHQMGACYQAIEPCADEALVCRLHEFITPEAWDALDLIMVETSDSSSMHSEALWGNAARALCEAFRRPADMPPDVDPHPPCDRGPASSRGPMEWIMMEWDAYRWVRNRVSAAQVAADRAYARSMGFSNVW